MSLGRRTTVKIYTEMRRLIYFALGATVLSATSWVAFRYLYWDSNDWPTLFKTIREECIDKTQCRIRLDQAYRFPWSYAVIFSDSGELGYKESVIGQKLENYQEFCQGIAFLASDGSIVREEYSGCFEEWFALNRPALVRFVFGKQNYFKVHHNSPELCVLSYKSPTHNGFTGLNKGDGQKSYEIKEPQYCDLSLPLRPTTSPP